MSIPETNALDYFAQDTRWQLFGIDSREVYLEKFVLRAKYHELVPEAVINAHLAAEYLMAHAWSCWPMYDEALKKMTHIYEIAIKQKAKQIGNDLKQYANNGKAREKSLNTLIREIHKREPERQILDALLKSKDLRNIFAHPTTNSWMGGIQSSQNVIFYYINIINTLFLDYTLFEDYPNQMENIKSLQNAIESGLYRLKIGKEKYLIHHVLSWELYPSKSDPFLFIAFQMVTTNTYHSASEGYVADPIVIGLKVTKFTDESITGVSLDNGEAVVAEPTDHPIDRTVYQTYLSDIAKLNQERPKWPGEFILHHYAGWAIEKMKYQYLWENYTVPKAGDSG